MEKIISVSTMRTSDAAEIAGGTDSKLLMYRAGLGIFHSCDWRGKIDIVAGSGNNAGDGYVLALLLHRAGISCRIVRTSPKLSPDGAFYLEKCRELSIPIMTEMDFSQTDILVDCLLGTGFQGELRPDLHKWVEQINQSAAYTISVDINSGMNGDTGEGLCARADKTVSIGYLKYGHLCGLVQGTIGVLENYAIGIPCIGTYTPFYLPGEFVPAAEKEQPVPPVLQQLLSKSGISSGTPLEQLQKLGEIYADQLHFHTISSAAIEL